MQHTFRHELISFPNVTSIDSDSGLRYYITPDGKKYPSVTTVLASDQSKKDHLQKWKENVGEEKAKQISAYAANRGSLIHNLAEKFVKNEPLELAKVNPYIVGLFLPLRDHLARVVDELWACEAGVYSDKLKIAGRTDLVGVINGRKKILDIKTSTKPKRKEWISSYFMQTAAYSYCIAERTGIRINEFHICIVNEQDNNVDVFEGKCSDYIVDFYKLRKQFDEAIDAGTPNHAIISDNNGCSTENQTT